MAPLRVALCSEVFFGGGAAARLDAALNRARDRGACLVLLPELPCDPWVPATRDVRDDDAEDEDGPRLRMLTEAARSVGIWVTGGAIVRARDGARHNTAIVAAPDGTVAASYAKTHVPQEPGFWERDHYRDGRDPPQPFVVDGTPVGIQICSDIQRPQLALALAAMGAVAILHPRATERATLARWEATVCATARAACAWVLSVPRRDPEGGVPLGGPSLAIDPTGEVAVRSEEPIAMIEIDAAQVEAARREYPGYLPVRSDLYARAWATAPGRAFEE